MKFTVLPMRASTPPAIHAAFLEVNGWNDYGYETMFKLTYRDRRGNLKSIGFVKIAQFGMNEPRKRGIRIELPEEFEFLSGSDYFSLGQDDTYYEELNKLGEDTRETILSALNDIAANLQLFDVALEEDVTRTSLLRGITESTVRQQFHRMTQGGARLSPYRFSYEYPGSTNYGSSKPPTLYFSVQPGSHPPTNVHVIIGRNGVGKSRLLYHMARILAGPTGERNLGSVEFGTTEGGRRRRGRDQDDEPDHFANIVSVAFSAFDNFEPIVQSMSVRDAMRYTYIGLKTTDESEEISVVGTTKSNEMLAKDFGSSVNACVDGARFRRWRGALETLESDPIFADAQFSELATSDEERDERLEDRAVALFNDLSSGHKVVLLTITRLVESIEEGTLVLLDEPESHLHPPLLSAFVRALSDLLIDRNGVAIVATHSPVVLQEVPRDCVWRLRRSGSVVAADRPEIETFGENVGFLTHEIFGLEVTHSGFHKMVAESIDSEETYREALSKFEGRLGSEAKALLQSMIAVRDSDNSR
jgi:predicted ATPase